MPDTLICYLSLISSHIQMGLSNYIKRYNIRVNSVHPGAIQTPMLEGEDTQDGLKETLKSIPLQRVLRT